jgi:predicted nucleotidyltransferase
VDTQSALRSVRPKSGLSDKVWKGGALRPEIANALGRIAKRFLVELELELDVEDVVLTGSYAGRTWGPGSDLDLHIIVDFSSFDDPEAAQRACKLAKFKWEEEHDITLKGIPVEVYVEGIDEDPPKVTGRWSIPKNEWLLEPPEGDPSFDESKVVKKVMDFREVIQRARRERSEGPMMSAMKRITKLRKAGLERDGELSSENLAYRVLRRTGELQAAWDDIHDLVDRQLSI